MVLIFLVILGLLSWAILAELDEGGNPPEPIAGSCPQCRLKVEGDWILCPHCRTLLKNTCCGCGHPAAIFHSFCPFCGTRQKRGGDGF